MLSKMISLPSVSESNTMQQEFV